MKAIIIAGGKGTRLGKYAKNLPKCMLKFAGKPLLGWQVEIFKKCGINEIVVLGGHLSEKINVKGIIRSYKDPDWVKNMVNALFAAEQELIGVEDSVIVSYGDIIFDEKTLKKVIECEKDICVAVDDNWKGYWNSRFDGKLEDLESLQMENSGKIIEIGTPNCQIEKCHSRYVGLLKFSKTGIDILRERYHKNKEQYWDKDVKWFNSKSFQQAYMTDMLQAIITEGYEIWPIHLSGGWLEFDTEKDYELANKWLQEKTLNRFIKIEDDK